MRVFLILLMFALLPLQFSAAAATECCGHVAVAQGFQVQHHQPTHLLPIQGADDLTANELGFDLDCGTCHANCAAAVMETVATMADPAGIELVAHLVELILPPWHERPYRPQWSAPKHSGLNRSV
ncbi:hypothetical protein [Hydrogenophaga sp.]|jgi:hypothetical protein|uniref:hypothetical protein n=1 Tax=Hydrogenophaga sp. TaxID=1904254 RepID=UPI00271C0692|nr:hypothetical protein [Hydrogenophaga sp.]MDO9132112.1 hypothetical protein [Hydrogenophaga sp.]MDP3628915.1 hypothetical protein [Hydrogenophaga sp.]MDZ4280681.1 hypothetical protein [Hydrogenophaga sp.]